MKRILRWATSPFRRAVMARFDARVVRLVSSTIGGRMMPPILDSLASTQEHLERIERIVERAERSASTVAEEVDIVLAGLSREIFRLQSQVERLREDERPALGGLSLHSATEEDTPEISPAERSRVG